ncbi:MAG: cytochrome c1 [Pseudomonadota bacterium]
MKRRMLKNIAAAATLVLGTTAFGAGGGGEIKDFDFSFEGVFGKFDQAQLQRGAQVYQEVCSACHGLELVAFRTLHDWGGPGFTNDQVKAFAENFEVYDVEQDDFRTAGANDKFPPSNLENAPDLSLMAKARVGGADYIASLLTTYTGEEIESGDSFFYGNKTYGNIAMAPPLSDELVEFADGAPNDVKHMSEDVAAFLMWTAEPKMMHRKRIGFVGVTFLSLLALLLYLTNKKLWADVKRKKA